MYSVRIYTDILLVTPNTLYKGQNKFKTVAECHSVMKLKGLSNYLIKDDNDRVIFDTFSDKLRKS